MAQQHKVLITGVAGFIGSNLADRMLKAGHSVVGIDNLAYGRKWQIPTGVDFREIDIRSKDMYSAFQGVDTVFHLAAKNDLLECQADPVETMDINVHGTANVFEAAKQAGVKKVIFATSSALEEGESRIKGFYAISKSACEKIADGYHAAFGINYVLARYFNVYGPGQDYRRVHPPIMSLLMMKAFRKEQPMLYESCDVDKRDFIYVDDISDFHLMCLDDDRTNNRLFRLGAGKSVSMREVWEAVKKVSGSNLEPVVKPNPTNFIATATLADTTDAAGIGWHAKTSLEDGLALQWEYIKGEFAKGNIK